MKRRALLASVGVGVSTGLAGCFGGGNNNSNDQQTESGGRASTPTGTPLGEEAQLSLRQIDAPPSAEIQLEYTFRIHVRNSGEQPGVYTAPVTVRRSGESQYRQVTEALVYVEPGETQAAEISIPPFSGIGSANIRIESPQNQWRVDITGPELTYGEYFTLPGQMPISVQRVDLAQNNGGVGPNGSEVTAPSGEQYVFAHIEVQNNADTEDFIPEPDSFSVQYQGTQYTPVFFGGQGRYTQAIVSSGTTYQGWIPFVVPSSASLDDLTVKYSSGTSTDSLLAFWQSEAAISDGEAGSNTGTETTTPQG